jgi:hypothetical protein
MPTVLALAAGAVIAAAASIAVLGRLNQPRVHGRETAVDVDKNVQEGSGKLTW